MTDTTARTVLITGAGRGIGRATAELFYRQGDNVVLVSRTMSELSKTAEEISSGDQRRMLFLAGDVSDEDFVTSVFLKAKEKFGPIDVLVNNAAIIVVKDFASHTAQEWDEIIRINVRGVFLCSRMFFRQFDHPDTKQSRIILNVSTLGGIQHTQKFPGLSSYVASKFAVTGLTEALAVEGKKLGINVIGIAPGAVDTEMLRKAAPHLKAGATPQDIARILVDLAHSPSSAIVSGAMIPLDTNA